MVKKSSLYFFGAALLAAVFFNACDVGLGESVDVTEPSVSITYPPASVAIRENFTLAGTCSDDKGVAAVKVTITNSETNKDCGTFDAVVGEKNNWTLDVNAKNEDGTYPLSDGKYTFDVIAIDTSGKKSGKSSRGFEIDNTEPVFIIKNPGSIDSENPSAFGSIFKIAGTISDDHDIHEMSVSVFKAGNETETPDKILTEYNINTAGGTEVTFARYNPKAALAETDPLYEAPDTLHQNYLTIYGESGGTQKFSTVVTVKDSAGVWRTPKNTSADSIGNVTTGLYLNDDVYEELMSKTSVYGQLTASDFKKILNGTYNNSKTEETASRSVVTSMTDEQATAIKAKLTAAIKDTTKNRLSFTLNKDANPTYSITGFGFKAANIENFGKRKAAKEGTLTFRALAGLDGTNFVPNKLKIYMFGPYDSGFTVEAMQSRLDSIYSNAETYYENQIAEGKSAAGEGATEELIRAYAKAQILADLSEKADTKNLSSTGDLTYSIELPSIITKGKYYVIAASGMDMDTLPFINESYFGFVGESAGTPPTVVINGFDDNAVVSDISKLSVSGTVSSEETEIASVVYKVTVTDELNKSAPVGTKTADAEKNLVSGNLSGTWNVALNEYLPADGSMYKYVLNITAKDSTGLAATETRSFTIDKKYPEVKINSITPVAKTETVENVEKNYVNGTVSFTANVTDSNLTNVKVTAASAGSEAKVIYSGEASFVDEKIDTTEFTDEKDLTFTVVGTDKAGNTTTQTKTVFVSQKTDIPEISSGNAKNSTEVKSFDEVTNGKNVFGVTNNNSIAFVLKDDDGIKDVKLILKNESGAKVKVDPTSKLAVALGENEQYTETYSLNGATSYSFNFALPQQEGKFTVEMSVTDIYYDSTTDSEIKKNRTNNAAYFLKVDENNMVIAFEGNSIINGVCEAQGGSGKTQTVNGTLSITDLAKVRIIERFPMTYNATEQKWVASTVSDSQYPKDQTQGSTKGEITAAISAGKLHWVDSITTGTVSQVNHYLYKATSVTDSSVSIELTCNIDANVPSLTYYEWKDGWSTASSIKLIMIAGDTAGGYNSGVNGVTYSYNSNTVDLAPGAVCDVDGKETEGLTKNYRKYSSIIGFEDGENTIPFTATDKVGNAAIQNAKMVYVDTKAPVDSQASGYITADQVKKNSETVAVSYNWTDANDSKAVSGIKEIVFDTNNNFNLNKQTVSGAEVKDGQGASLNPVRYGKTLSGTYNFALTGLTDGEYTIYMKAVDYAGNESAIVSVGKVVVDSTAPSVNYSNIAYATGSTSGTASSGKKINKTVTLSGQVSDNNFVSNGSLPELYYYDATNLKWKNVSDLNSSAVSSKSRTDNSWSFEFDTTKVSSLAGEKYYQVVVVDKAGNSSLNNAAPTSGSYKLNIDQNSDRPTIKLSNIKTSGSVIKTDSVVGTINDDDGDVKGIWKIDSTTFDGLASKTYPDVSTAAKLAQETNNGWSKLKLEGVSWSISAANTNSWYFYVVDYNGTAFCTKASDGTGRPYIQGVGDTSAADNSTAVAFTVDQTPPAIQVYVANSELAADAATGWSSVGGTFSGTANSGYEKVYLKVVATEAVGMEMNGSEYKLPTVTFSGTSIAVAKRTNNGITNSGNVYTYLLNPIDLSAGSYSEGQIQVVAALSDSSGNPGQGGLSITLDKEAPEVKIISPTTNVSDAVTSSITVKGIVTDTHSSIKKLEWAIPLKGETDVSKYTWTTIAANASWEINFASGAKESTDSLLYYVNAKQTGSTNDKYDISATTTENIYKVPVYFRATDSVGNVAVRNSYTDKSSNETKDLYVLVDSEGGKPKAWINTPEAGKTTNGLVTIYGGASDDVSVTRVQLKINGSETIVEATGTNSWKYTIDSSVAANRCTRNGKAAIAVQVRALDENGESQTREWTQEHIVYIDAEVPVIENLKLVQYGKNVTPALASSPITEREYEAGMYLSNKSVAENGSWYLTGDVRDNTQVSKISAVTLSSETTNVIGLPTSTVGDDEKSLIAKSVANSSVNGYKLLVPVTTSEAGMIYSKITACDNSNGETSVVIKINIDSSAPSLYNTSNSETTDAFTNSDLRLKSQSQIIGNGTGITTTVINSNNFFTFGDYVSEAGSGLSFIAFYYEREKSDGTDKRVYNPMYGTSNRTALSSTSNAGDLYINADKLPAFVVEHNGSRTDAGSFTSTGIQNNNNVRVGGLIKIGGNYSRITSVDRSSGSVTFTPEVSTSFTTAEIIYAQIVDHEITESWDSSSSKVVNDDGDEMVESITQIGATYSWTSSINSNNIPDGPVTITVVASDKAGNISYGNIKTKVENNRPRLTKVMLATDLNGNGKYDLNASSAPIVSVDSEKATADGKSYGEFSYYSAFNKQTGNGQYDVELASGSFKVISGLMIVPEFTGGNGSLKYVLSNGAKATGPETSNTLNQMATRSAISSLITEQGGKSLFGNSSTVSDNVISYKDYDFGALSLASSHAAFEKDGEKYINVTFWDATEETTQGTDSQWALLKIPVTVKSNDSVPPDAKIRPFYWNGKSENSVYVDNNVLQGHIELGDSPKVSGKIKIEGIVSDDVRLSSITAKVFGLSETAETVGNYSNGSWTAAASLPAGVVSFSATDLDMSQNGHSVKYTIVVDTEQLTGAAGTARVITVGAKDWKGNSSTADSDQTASAEKTVNEIKYKTGTTNYYEMDVVPYITQVWTGLSEYERTYASMHNRASTGEYPVRVGETVKIYGWNLGESATVSVNGTSADDLTTRSNSDENVKQGTKYVELPIASSYSSGNVELSVNSVSALNNTNDNDAHGSAAEISAATESAKASADYSNYYNRIPNSQNNNILTDDVKLDVWDFKTAVTPVGSKANYVTMKVGPYIQGNDNSGRIGFSFKNGSTCFNMPGYMNSSSETLGKFTLYVKTSTYTNAHIYDSNNNLTGSWPGKTMTTASYNGSSGYKMVEVEGAYSGSVTAMFNNGGSSQESNKFILSSGPGKYVIESLSSKGSADQTITADETYSSYSSPVYSQTKVGENYQGFSYNTFAFDSNAETYGAALCSDTSGKDYISASLQFFARANGHSSSDLNRNYYNSNYARRIENTTFYKTDSPSYGTDKPDYDDERTQSLSMATYKNTDGTYVYMAYYDKGLNRITFRMGQVAGSGPSNDINYGLQDLVGSTGYQNVGTSGDGYKIGYYSSTVGDNKTMRHRNSTQSTYVGDKGEAYKYVNALSSISGSSASVVVGSLNDGTAVIAWYDSGRRKLCYTTVSLDVMKTGINGSSLGATEISTIGGTNVAMAIDADNGIHLAYMSNSGSDLYYSYKASGSTSFTEMLVDSKNDVGSYCSIDVGRKSATSEWIPYITYKSNEASQTKIAYPVEFTNSRPTAGATSGGFFTGTWAVSMLPSETVSISDRISVGIVKEWSSGVIHNFEGNWTDSVSVSTPAVYNVCNSTINTGNGTSNPVVGYAVATGSIEMAQKK